MSAISIKINPPLTDIRLADVLDAIVKVADRPIKYSIEDYAIVFSLKAREATPLFVRTFKVDPNTFYQGLQNVGVFELRSILQRRPKQQWQRRRFGRRAAAGWAAVAAAWAAGWAAGWAAAMAVGSGGGIGAMVARVSVSGGGGMGGGMGGGDGRRWAGWAGGMGGCGGGGLNFVTRPITRRDVSQAAISSTSRLWGWILIRSRNPGKAVFFNDRQGMLLVRATMQDLDIIEAAIQVLNVVPPQVNIKSKIVEVSQDDTKALGFDWYLGNVLMNNGSIVGGGGTAPSYSGAPTAANPLGDLPGQCRRRHSDCAQQHGPTLDFRPAQLLHNALHAYRHPDGPAVSHGHPRAAAAVRGRAAG